MDLLDILDVLIKLAVFIPLMTLCVYILGKIYGKGVGTLGRNMKVIERMQISKDNSISLVQICSKFYLISSSNEGVKILKELEGEEIQEMETNPPIDMGSISKIFTRKGDKNDKK